MSEKVMGLKLDINKQSGGETIKIAFNRRFVIETKNKKCTFLNKNIAKNHKKHCIFWHF